MTSEQTIFTYNSCLNHLTKLNVNYVNPDDFPNLLSNLKKQQCRNGKPISISTYKLWITSILWYYKTNNINIDYIQPLRDEMISTKTIIDDISKQNVLTGHQLNNYLSWNKILEVYDIVKTNYLKSKDSHMNYVILSCYILLCPRRLKDYSLMHVTTTLDNLSSEFNYYYYNSLTNDRLFVFNNYKTSKSYNTQKVVVPSQLDIILQKYINTYNIQNSLFSLSSINLEHRLMRLFYKYTGKNISVNILRHSYISYMIDTNKIQDNEETISLIMGHSVPMQKIYYKNETKELQPHTLTQSTKIIGSPLVQPNIVYDN